MMNRPNIVLLVLDTHRVDRLSCYGYHLETTPHLDHFAADAALFSHAISPAQWTLPVHASMFTGLYPSQHTMFQLNSILPPTLDTLAQRLQQEGYFNAIFSENPLIGAKNNGLERGFHSISNYNYAGLGFWTTHLGQEAGLYQNPVKWGRYQIRKLLAHWMGYGQSYSTHWYSKILSPVLESLVKLRGGSKGKNTRRLLRDAAEFLIKQSDLTPHQPTFAFINLMGTHIPYNPPSWAIRDFVGAEPNLSNARLNQINSLAVNIKNWLKTEDFSAEDSALLNGIYDAEVAAQDKQIGEFLRSLKDAKVLDNTFFVVVADHGEHLGEKQRISHLIGAYEELLHVPLLIHDPLRRLLPGQEYNQFVSTRRLFHTILTAVGAASEEEESLSLFNPDSRKIDAEGGEHNMAFAEARTPDWILRQLNQKYADHPEIHEYGHLSKAVYHKEYKLINLDNNRQVELYNIHNDPAEHDNLRYAMPETLEDLQTLLNTFTQETSPTVEDTTQEEDAPQVLEQLRNLGYLE